MRVKKAKEVGKNAEQSFFLIPNQCEKEGEIFACMGIKLLWMSDCVNTLAGTSASIRCYN